VKDVRNKMYRNTETLLYNFQALKKHLENEEEYLAMALHQSSKSFVRYQKNNSGKTTNDELLDARRRSYERSKSDCQRIQAALDAVCNDKAYIIIKLRYLDNRRLTYEEIAEMLQGKYGFSEHLTEKTVRRHKTRLVRKIAVILFGTDAII